MDSNSEASATVTGGEGLLQRSFSIRAPLTVDDSDSEFDISSDATLSDTASHSHSDESQTQNPSVAEADPEPHYHSSQEEEEEEGSVEADEFSPLVELPGVPLRVAPFAQLSTYDDDGESSDETLSAVRVPENSFGVHRLRVRDVDEEEEEEEEEEEVEEVEQEGENAETYCMNSLPVSQSLLANELAFCSDSGSDIYSEDENAITDVRVEEAIGIRVAHDGYSTSNDTDEISQFSQESANNEEFGNVRGGFEELEKDDREIYEEIATGLIGIDVKKLEVDTNDITDMVKGTSIMVDDTGLLKFNDEGFDKIVVLPTQDTSVCHLQEQNSQIHSMKDGPASDAFAENIECCSTTERTAANGNQGVASDQERECEKLASTAKSVMDPKADTQDSCAGLEPNDDACEGNVIEAVESFELSDPILLRECAYLESDLSETVLVNVIQQDDELFSDYHSHGLIGTDVKKLEVDTNDFTDMVKGTSIMADDTSLLKFNGEDFDKIVVMPAQGTSLFHLQVQHSQIHSMADGPAPDAFAENVECYTTTQRSAANGSQCGASDQESECEKPISISTSLFNSKAELQDPSAGLEPNNADCEGNIIETVESSELFDPILLQECVFLENDLSGTVLGVIQQNELFSDNHSHENVETHSLGDTLLKIVSQESIRNDDSASDGCVEGLMSVDLDQFREHISALSILLGSSKDSEKISGGEDIVRSSHGEMNLTNDDVKSQLIYVDGGGESDGKVTFTYADESSVIFLKDPAGFSSLPHYDAQAGFQHNISEQEGETIQKIQTISVKFLRLVQRVNLSFEDSLVSKVLCRLVADIGRRSHQEFVISSAKISAMKLEEDFQDDLDFSLNILVLGKCGVGKSATINSIFGDMKVVTNAFEPATTSVKEVSGTIDGVKIRILDTPGLRSSVKEQAFNRKILSSVKRYIKKFPLDVILYVDRLDDQTGDLNDLPMLRSITSSLGPSIWQNVILTLTHAASTPLDGPSGSPLSYEVFVAQKSYIVQQSMTKAAGDLCQLSPSFICPVSLVENHPSCGKSISGSGDCVLPNGLRWRSQLLALCFSLKILSQVSSVSGPQTLFDQWKQFFLEDHPQPLCHLASSLLQSPAHLKFSANWN